MSTTTCNINLFKELTQNYFLGNRYINKNKIIKYYKNKYRVEDQYKHYLKKMENIN